MKKRTVKILSFVGGAVFFSAVAAAVILKNEKVRSELGVQAKTLLETSKQAVEQVQFVAGKIGQINENLKSVKIDSNIIDTQKSFADSYDSLWSDAESQVRGFSQQ